MFFFLLWNFRVEMPPPPTAINLELLMLLLPAKLNNSTSAKQLSREAACVNELAFYRALFAWFGYREATVAKSMRVHFEVLSDFILDLPKTEGEESSAEPHPPLYAGIEADILTALRKVRGWPIYPVEHSLPPALAARVQATIGKVGNNPLVVPFENFEDCKFLFKTLETFAARYPQLIAQWGTDDATVIGMTPWPILYDLVNETGGKQQALVVLMLEAKAVAYYALRFANLNALQRKAPGKDVVREMFWHAAYFLSTEEANPDTTNPRPRYVQYIVEARARLADTTAVIPRLLALGDTMASYVAVLRDAGWIFHNARQERQLRCVLDMCNVAFDMLEDEEAAGGQAPAVEAPAAQAPAAVVVQAPAAVVQAPAVIQTPAAAVIQTPAAVQPPLNPSVLQQLDRTLDDLMQSARPLEASQGAEQKKAKARKTAEVEKREAELLMARFGSYGEDEDEYLELLDNLAVSNEEEQTTTPEPTASRFTVSAPADDTPLSFVVPPVAAVSTDALSPDSSSKKKSNQSQRRKRAKEQTLLEVSAVVDALCGQVALEVARELVAEEAARKQREELALAREAARRARIEEQKRAREAARLERIRAEEAMRQERLRAQELARMERLRAQEEARARAEAERARAEEAARLEQARAEEERVRREAFRVRELELARENAIPPNYAREMAAALVEPVEFALQPAIDCFICFQPVDFTDTAVLYLTCCEGGSFACAQCVAGHLSHPVRGEHQIVRLTAALRRKFKVGEFA